MNALAGRMRSTLLRSSLNPLWYRAPVPGNTRQLVGLGHWCDASVLPVSAFLDQTIVLLQRQLHSCGVVNV
jgi:hypothetical protein